MIRFGLFTEILSILFFSFVFCGTEISDSRCKTDLEKGLSLFGTVEDIHAEKAISVKESFSSGSKDLLYVPFSAKVKLKEDLRNYVHHAQEGRYHREYVGWVMQNSANKSGTEKLLHFSLLANLSSSRWYDAKSGQIIPLKGVLRYKKEGSEWISLGAFDN
ncbi:hypothetical protein EHQ81_01195 [Leptospira selangorensis]|uniref:Uncharacterized protein n=1 Tax=Leptospira selangorensis TaxID=2484982 RepID=A0A5F2BW45_9LEPT|nr:hypothetical protein [Leptospira selangorensis]TGM12523.1 hypothetical protein EHQ82_20080 [Leptospira selangorensis]TGM16751.1 hypothetical protein EHQ81_01195 [Leptospira selangorensis]